MEKEKYYSETAIRDAVWETNKKYRDCMSIMSFHDMILIENVLMNFEMRLFNGDVREDAECRN